jgi:hypothetical protein
MEDPRRTRWFPVVVRSVSRRSGPAPIAERNSCDPKLCRISNMLRRDRISQAGKRAFQAAKRDERQASFDPGRRGFDPRLSLFPLVSYGSQILLQPKCSPFISYMSRGCQRDTLLASEFSVRCSISTAWLGKSIRRLGDWRRSERQLK